MFFRSVYGNLNFASAFSFTVEELMEANMGRGILLWLLGVPIPVLSIQPLVENAIKHGLAMQSGPGYVRVKATCRGGELRISVENSGAGAAGGEGAGMGLQNVRRRLEICYGGSSQLQLSLNPQNTVAELTIPLAAAVHRD